MPKCVAHDEKHGTSTSTSTTSAPAPSSNAGSGGTIMPLPEDRWKKALSQLKDRGLLAPDVDLDGSSKREVLLEVLSLVRGAELTCQQKRWKWKNKKGETVIVRDVFVKMSVWIEKFKAVGDSIVQYDPGHAALPWAAARFILQAALNDIETNGAMLEGLELVFHLIAKFEVIERLYVQNASTATLQHQVDDSIIALYGSILEYLLDARNYFLQRTAVRIAKSIFQLEDMKSKHVSSILTKAGKVDEYIQLISGEIAKKTQSLVAQVTGKMQVLALHTGKLDNIQDLLEEEKAFLESVLSDLGEPIKRMSSQISNIEDKLREDERLQIFDWLSSIEYNSHHRTKTKILLPDSGQWLLKKPEFKNWMGSSNSSLLWLHGIPGSGKSMLVAHVIEHIKKRNGTEISPAPLAYFYCSRNTTEPERSDPVELIRCILEQLSCSDLDLPIRLPVVKAYQLRRREVRGRRPGKLDFEDAVKLILELLEDNPATIVIDALDECDPARRQELLNALQLIIKESNNVVKIFVSSRDDHDLVHRLSRSANLYIDSAQNMDDITKFVTTRVREAIRKEKILCGQVPPRLREQIITTLIEKAKGMFRLVSLHIETLCDPTRVKTKANVLYVLANLPPDLEKSYAYILAQIASSQRPNPEIASRIFKWLLCSREQLSSQTFILAVCTGMRDVGLISQADVLSVCSNLVVYDEDTDSFRFAHLSVLEYLDRLNEYCPEAANAFCAEQCLSWMVNREEEHFTNSDFSVLIERELSINGRNTKRRSTKSRHYAFSALASVMYINAIQSFGYHADQEWGEYARRAGSRRCQGRLQKLLHGFLRPTPGSLEVSASADFALWMDRIPTGTTSTSNQPSKVLDYDFLKNWQKSPLFACCAFDLAEVVAEMLDTIPDCLVTHSSWDYDCLIIAAECNSVATIDVLIAESKRQGLLMSSWQRPLWGAVCNLHFRVVESILRHTGRSYFPSSYFDNFVFLRFLATSVQSNYENTLLLLLNHNDELQLTEEILVQLFSNKFHSGKSFSGALLRSGKTIHITRSLVNSSFANASCGREILDTLLASDRTKIAHDAFIDLFRHADIPNASPADKTLLFLLKKRKEYRLLLPRIKVLQATPFTRCHQLSHIAELAHAKLLDLHEGLLDVLLPQAGNEVELTWEHLLLLSNEKHRGECVRCILSCRPKISQTTVNMLLSAWSESLIKELLKFRDIKVSREVVKVVAWNEKYGAEIMRALLEREMEELCL